MKRRKLKKTAIYGLYSIALLCMIGTIYLIETATSKKQFKSEEYSYVSKTIFDQITPVLKTEEKIIVPYQDEEVKELKKYYDYKTDEKNQEEAIINIDDTYMQSKGISYGKENTFDIISSLPGTVEEIKEDELLGKVVKIKHNDKVSTMYGCLSETTIQENDQVISGQVIGQSGTCTLEKDNNKKVYFEILVNGKNVNPSIYLNKTLKEIGE